MAHNESYGVPARNPGRRTRAAITESASLIRGLLHMTDMADTIYLSEKRLGQLRDNIEQSSLTKTNKKLLLDFERAMQLVEQLGNQRRVRLLGSLFLLARDYFGPDLRKTTVTEIKKCIADIESKPFSPWTKVYYKVAIRKFFKWLAYRDQVSQIKKFPPLVSWIGTHLKRKDRPVIRASDLL